MFAIIIQKLRLICKISYKNYKKCRFSLFFRFYTLYIYIIIRLCGGRFCCPAVVCCSLGDVVRIAAALLLSVVLCGSLWCPGAPRAHITRKTPTGTHAGRRAWRLESLHSMRHRVFSQKGNFQKNNKLQNELGQSN